MPAPNLLQIYTGFAYRGAALLEEITAMTRCAAGMIADDQP